MLFHLLQESAERSFQAQVLLDDVERILAQSVADVVVEGVGVGVDDVVERPSAQ